MLAEKFLFLHFYLVSSACRIEKKIENKLLSNRILNERDERGVQMESPDG